MYIAISFHITLLQRWFSYCFRHFAIPHQSSQFFSESYFLNNSCVRSIMNSDWTMCNVSSNIYRCILTKVLYRLKAAFAFYLKTISAVYSIAHEGLILIVTSISVSYFYKKWVHVRIYVYIDFDKMAAFLTDLMYI